MQAKALRSWWLYPLCIALVLGAHLLLNLANVTYHHPDSSYLRARYARNLLNGDGFGYNPHERLLSTSAPLVVVGQVLASLPQHEITSPPEALTFVMMGIALAGLLRLLARQAIPLPLMLGASLVWAIPLWLTFGGIELWLAAFSLLVLDLAAHEKWLWAGLLLLIAPLAIIFVFLIGVIAPRRYWGLVWLAPAIWGMVALLYFDVDGLTLPTAPGEGFLGIFSGLVLLPVLGGLYVTFANLPALWRVLVVWSFAYSLCGVLFGLTSDATLLTLALLVMLVWAWQHQPSRQLQALLGGMSLGCLLWGVIHFEPLPTKPSLWEETDESTLLMIGSHQAAFAWQGAVYHLDGKLDPQLRELWLAGDSAGGRIASYPTWQPSQAVNMSFGEDVSLAQVTQDHFAVTQELRLHLAWYLAKFPPQPLQMLFHALDINSRAYNLGESTFPPNHWEFTTDTYHHLPLETTMPAGLYRVQVTLDYEGGILGKQTIATFKIPLQDNRVFADPPLAQFGDSQAELMQAEIQLRGEQVEVRLVWRAGSRMEADYTVFIHLTQVDNPTPLAQVDQHPLNGRYPTFIWETGEVIEDHYNLLIAGLPPGDYVLRVGFFNPQQGRIPLTEGGDAFILGNVVLP